MKVKNENTSNSKLLDFTELTVAKLIIHLVNDDRNFRLTCKDMKKGIFGDITIINASQNNGVKEIGIHLQYSDKNKKISKKSLEKSNGKFCIEKYYTEFKTFRTTNYSVVLVTNRRLSRKVNSLSLPYKDKKVKLNIIQVEKSPIFSIFEKCNGIVYQLEVDDSDKPNQDIEIDSDLQEFLKNFYLCPSLIKRKDLETEFVHDFQEMFTCEVGPAEEFIKFVRDWQDNSDGKNDQEFFASEIVRYLLPSLIPNVFKDETLKPTNLSNLDKQMLERIKLLLEALNNFQLTQILIPLDDIKHEFLNVVWNTIHDSGISTSEFWASGNTPIIIDSSEDNTKKWNKCAQLLSMARYKKKLVFFGPHKIDFTHTTDVWNNLGDLQKKNSDLYKTIISDLKFSFFGRDIPLGEETGSTLFTPTHLIKIIEGYFKIGDANAFVGHENLERYYELPCIDFEFLKQVSEGRIENTVALVICKDQKKLKQNLLGVDVHQLSEFNPNRSIYICDPKNSEQGFLKFSKKTTNKKCHLFEYAEQSDSLVWIKSTQSVEDLQPYRLNDDHNPTINEENLLERKQKINLLCGIVGEARTAALLRLTQKYKGNYWILRINVLHYRFLFQTNNYNLFLQHTLRRTEGANDILLLEIFSILLAQNRVILMWDIVGEGPYEENNGKYILDAIKEFNKRGIEQWIIAQLPQQHQLEKRFNVLAAIFGPLTEDKQTDLIKMYECEASEEDIEKVKESLNLSPKIVKKLFGEFYRIFLLVKWFENEKSSSSLHPTLSQLFDNYIRNENRFTEDMDMELANYEKAALKCCFDDDFITENLSAKKADQFIEYVSMYGDQDDQIKKNKLIHKVSSTNIPIYEHVTITDYLIACYLLHNSKNIANMDFLFQPQYRRIRYLYDLKMSENLPIHTAVLCQNKEELRRTTIAINIRDSNQRTPLDLAASWGAYHPGVRVESAEENTVIFVQNWENYDDSEQIETVDILLEREPFAVEEALELARKTKGLSMIDTILKHNPQTIQFTPTEIHSALYYSIRNGYKYILNNMEKFPDVAKIKLSNGDSLWHLAAFYGEEEFFRKCGQPNVLTQHGELPIHVASRKGHLNIVKLLVDPSTDINVKCNKGRTPLSIASERGNLEIVKFLIKEKSNVNTHDNDQKTPISYACEQGHLDIVALLVNSKANINFSDNMGRTCLHKAAKNNHLEIVKYLIQQCGADVSSKDAENATPLLMSAQEGHPAIVDYLLRNGADVSSRFKNGSSAICIASENGHLEVVNLLILHGININEEDYEGRNGLWMAACGGHFEIVKFLIEEKNADVNSCDKNGSSPLLVCAQEGNLEIVKYLMHKNGDLNCKNRVGATPIICACQNGHLEVVKYLVDKGANPAEEDAEGCNGLWNAASEGHLELVKFLLLENKVNPTKGNKNGLLPLHAACQNGHLKIVKLLPRYANIRTENGQTPLHLSAQSNHLKIVQYLVEKNAQIDSRDKNGSTPLHLACLRGHLNVVEYLHSCQADLNLSAYDQCSPIHLAATYGQLGIVKFLAEKGAFLNRRDLNGATPIHAAAKHGHLDIIKYLTELKVNIDFADVLGRTPLWEAAYYKHLDIVKFLEERGAYLDSCTENGITPLHAATRRGFTEIVQFLIENGANAEICDVNGSSIACTGVLLGYKPIISIFEQYDIDVCSNSGYSLNEIRSMLKDIQHSEYHFS